MTIGTAHRRARPAGFSLVEILVVLAIIALVGTLLMPGVTSITRSISEQEPDRMVWDAITAARAQALNSNRTVWMRVDAKTRLLQWGDGGTTGKSEFPAGTTIQFLQAVAGGQVLLGGVLTETKELSAVRFFPDGTCDPFRVQLIRGGFSPMVSAVDPWTCAPILRSEAKP